MSIDDVFEECAAADIRIQVHSVALRVTNASALTPELRAGLKQHKSQIVRELSLPLMDYVSLLFPKCVEIGNNNKPVKKAVSSGGLF